MNDGPRPPRPLRAPRLHDLSLSADASRSTMKADVEVSMMELARGTEDALLHALRKAAERIAFTHAESDEFHDAVRAAMTQRWIRQIVKERIREIVDSYLPPGPLNPGASE